MWIVSIAIGVLGAGLALQGASIFAIADTSIHQVYAAVMLGSGAITLGLAAIHLHLCINQQSLAPPNLRPLPAPPEGDNWRVETCEGYKVVCLDIGGAMVDGHMFKTASDARSYIKRMT